MDGREFLTNELQKYSSICFYPSSGTDLSNLDFFCSGRKPREERKSGEKTISPVSGQSGEAQSDPELFIHTDVNFYQEFESGAEFELDEHGINGEYEITGFRELPSISEPNRIFQNFPHSGRCFEYKLRLWGGDKVRTLIYCLCENEYLVSEILLANQIKVPFIWSINWNGGLTCGTWLVNAVEKLGTRKVYTDWLCVPGRRGEPRNEAVAEKYPELVIPSRIRLVRNDEVHWIEEGDHGWVDEFDVVA